MARTEACADTCLCAQKQKASQNVDLRLFFKAIANAFFGAFPEGVTNEMILQTSGDEVWDVYFSYFIV